MTARWRSRLNSSEILPCSHVDHSKLIGGTAEFYPPKGIRASHFPPVSIASPLTDKIPHHITAQIMRFSISIAAIVIALTASMSVSACYDDGAACKVDDDCCNTPCNVSMSRLSCVQGSTHDSPRVVILQYNVCKNP
jgi:hypothetical protein